MPKYLALKARKCLRVSSDPILGRMLDRLAGTATRCRFTGDSRAADVGAGGLLLLLFSPDGGLVVVDVRGTLMGPRDRRRAVCKLARTLAEPAIWLGCCFLALVALVVLMHW